MTSEQYCMRVTRTCLSMNLKSKSFPGEPSSTVTPRSPQILKSSRISHLHCGHKSPYSRRVGAPRLVRRVLVEVLPGLLTGGKLSIGDRRIKLAPRSPRDRSIVCLLRTSVPPSPPPPVKTRVVVLLARGLFGLSESLINYRRRSRDVTP